MKHADRIVEKVPAIVADALTKWPNATQHGAENSLFSLGVSLYEKLDDTKNRITKHGREHFAQQIVCVYREKVLDFEDTQKRLENRCNYKMVTLLTQLLPTITNRKVHRKKRMGSSHVNFEIRTNFCHITSSCHRQCVTATMLTSKNQSKVCLTCQIQTMFLLTTASVE
ncbi:unnamed protein product [Albugo candida]|uniref:Uncharacterized protein n=1 Tax=Albugo candida TaxID=65357 RepID=A0A024FXC3_9STRA|nr:unnamed protein product [Albugo candida]|eukprot:CCI11537.1 unnamed protein product [Albugo candida]